MRQVTVIILDDSLLMRELMQHEIEKDINIKVVGKAATAFEARDQIIELRPDILIVDVNLGEVSGSSFVRQLLPQYYLPVIMISSNAAYEAIAREINAVDFVQKPAYGSNSEPDIFFKKIIASIKNIVFSNEEESQNIGKFTSNLIAIGASTGGADAIETILKNLPHLMPPIVIAQHMPERFTKTFSERLNLTSKLSVKEAEDGDILIPGQVYIAPGNMHTFIRKRNDKLYINCMNTDNFDVKVHPCINFLFESASEASGKKSIGVILTGMGKDGAEGLKSMHSKGAVTIGQDKASSIVYGMPKAAYESGAVDHQLPLDKIAKKIVSLR